MEKDSFPLHDHSAQRTQRQRASTAGSLLPDRPRTSIAPTSDRPRTFTAGPLMQVHHVWTPRPHRRFSAREQTTNNPNPEALLNTPSNIGGPSFSRNDTKMHRASSNPRFVAPRIASREGPGTEADEQASADHPGVNSGANASSDGTVSDESGADGNSKEDGESLVDIPSFWSHHEVVDSVWDLKDIPEKVQRTVDSLIEDVLDRQRQLSAEKKRTASLSQDKATLEKELQSMRVTKKELELQLSEHREALHTEREKSDGLQEGLKKLRAESNKEKHTFEKSQRSMKAELGELSNNLKKANKHVQLKDKELEQIHREVARTKQEIKDELSRRESAETESQVFKRDLFELRKRSSKEKREALACQEGNEEKITKLEELNKTFKAKVSMLEETLIKVSESNQDLEEDLLNVLYFLGRICQAIYQVYRAISVHGRRGIPEIVALPYSISLTIEEDCDDYQIFGQLFEQLKTSLSPSSVLEIAGPYEEALRGFFKTLVLRDVAHSHYVCSSDDAFEKMKDSLGEQGVHHTAIREALNTQKKILISWAENLAACQEELGTNIEAFGKLLRTNIEEFKKRLSSEVQEKDRLSQELDNAKATIKDLKEAASVSEEKHNKVEASLRHDLKDLRNLANQRESQLEELSKIERDLRKAKEELLCSSKQMVADVTESKKRSEVLIIEKEKYAKEKENSLKRLAEAEHALQQMSEKVTEAFAMRQRALEDLILEKKTTEELRSKLAKMSGNNSQVENHSLQKNNDSGEADFCEVDIVPKRPKRRASVQKQRKNPHQKRARSYGAIPATPAMCTPRDDAKPATASKQTVTPDYFGPQTSSESATGRDDEWTIETTFDKLGR